MPEGLPERMFLYDRFAQLYGWSPREVDELESDELYWLPVIRDAKAEAAEQVAKVQATD